MFYSFLPLLHVNTQSAIRSGLVLMLLARSIWVQSTLWCCIPHSGSMSPRLSPLLIPSALPAPTQSRGCSPPLRPKAPAPASMTFCRPIMLLTQPPAPAQHHIMGDGMTKWLLSAPVTAPQPYIPKLIKMARFVSVIANSSVCLHKPIPDTCSQVELIPRNFYFHWLIKIARNVYENSSAGFFPN